MRVIKKILRIITILLPCFCGVFFFSSDSFALNYYYEYLPYYSPYLYNSRTDSYDNPYTFEFGTASTRGVGVQSGLNSFTRTYYDNYPDCDHSYGVSLVQSYDTTLTHITVYNFTAYLNDSRSPIETCKDLARSGWYQYGASRFATVNPNASTIDSDSSVVIDGDTISSPRATVSKNTGLNVGSIIHNFRDGSSKELAGFSFPFYVPSDYRVTYSDPDDNYKVHTYAFYLEFMAFPDIAHNDLEVENPVSPVSGDYIGEVISHFDVAFYNSSLQQYEHERVDCSATFFRGTSGKVRFYCPFMSYQGSIGGNHTAYNGYVIDGTTPSWYLFTLDPNTLKMVDGYILFFNCAFLSVDGSIEAWNDDYGGLVPIYHGGDDPDSAPKGEFDHQGDVSFFNLFDFIFVNPFRPIFNSFTDQHTCVNIPIIGSMIHLEDTRICPLYPYTVYLYLTPVLSIIFPAMLVFGYFIKWLRKDDTVVIQYGKGGKK